MKHVVHHRRSSRAKTPSMSTQMPEIPEVNLPEPPLPKLELDPSVGTETGIITVDDATDLKSKADSNTTWLESILSTRIPISNDHPLNNLRNMSDNALSKSIDAGIKRIESEKLTETKKIQLKAIWDEKWEKGEIFNETNVADTDEEHTANEHKEGHLMFHTVKSGDGYIPLPSRKQESWRFTDLRSLYASRYQSASHSTTSSNGNGIPSSLSEFDISQYISEEAGSVLVFVDGVYNEHMSNVTQSDQVQEIMDSGGFIGSITDYKGNISKLETMWSSAELSGDDISNGGGLFPVVGNAIISDAAVIDIPAEYSSTKPIVVCYISTSSSSGSSASAPRLAILAGNRSSSTLIEYHVSSNYSSGPDSTATILGGTGIDISDNASLTHYILNSVCDTTNIISSLQSTLHTSSSYDLRHVGLGGMIGRLSVGIHLKGDSSITNVKGLLLTDENHTQDLHSNVRHDAAHTRCNQLQKNIASGKGRAVFCGKIIVTDKCADTDSQQLSKSLILSEGASVDAMPTLVIANDDVQCSHGATVSDLSEDELFYCRSRGLTHIQAQSLLIMGFVGQVLGDCELLSVPKLVQSRVEQISEKSKERSTEDAVFTSA